MAFAVFCFPYFYCLREIKLSKQHFSRGLMYFLGKAFDLRTYSIFLILVCVSLEGVQQLPSCMISVLS